MSRLAVFWRCCVSDGVPRRSLYAAALVGTILNLINQGDVIVRAGKIDIIKMVLTFAVPYCVATYGAVSQRLAATQSVRSHDPS